MGKVQGESFEGGKGERRSRGKGKTAFVGRGCRKVDVVKHHGKGFAGNNWGGSDLYGMGKKRKKKKIKRESLVKHCFQGGGGGEEGLDNRGGV